MDTPFRWPASFRAAVSLSYDDALPVHAALVAPTLEQHGLRATFYTPIISDLRAHPDNWRRVAAAGHELGNHSIFHPCRRIPPEGYGWLDAAYDLADYSPGRLHAELDVASFTLSLIDGRTVRTFGNTCCHTTIGRGADEQPIAPVLARSFVAARGAQTDRPAPPAALDLHDIGCFGADGLGLRALQAIVEAARAQGGWSLLMIHGVGSESHHMHLEPEVHRQFVAWLAQQRDVWTAPVIEVAAFVRQARELA